MSTETRRAELRERLLDAAEAAIDEGGLHAIKARDLADVAGCSVGQIYNVFSDLDDLILSVNLRTLMALDLAMGRAAGDVGLDPVPRLQALGQAYLDFALSRPRRWRALFEHRLPDGYPVPDWYAERLDQLFGHLRGPLALLLPDRRGEALGDVANAMFAGTHGIVLLGLDGKLGKVSPTVIARRIQFLIGAALVGASRLG